MDSKKIKPNTWLWWVGEDKPVFVDEILTDGYIMAYVPRILDSMTPHIVSKVLRAIDLERLGEWSELEF